MTFRTPARMLKEQMAVFVPERFAVPRTLAMFAASIATADDDAMTAALQLGQKHAISRQSYYEVVLQSYLFLGFPRMLLAVDLLNRERPVKKPSDPMGDICDEEFRNWWTNGQALCREIYGTAFEPLRARIGSSAPEVFRWMIMEGYGKVMSRPGLGKIEREVCSVAYLIMDGYEQQLHSHMRGASNLGASAELLSMVIDDVGPAGAAGGDPARRILQKIGGR
jgi:4-carboxymuconolactone decarboxylase